MPELADKSDVVIIGGVAAGPKTAATLARRLPGARITLFQKEKHLSYAKCGFPFLASGELGSFDALVQTSYGVARDSGFFQSSKGFKTVTSAEVTQINRGKKTVSVRMCETGETFEHGYGRLVIATGSIPNRPPIPMPQSDRVRPFSSPADVTGFRDLAQRGEIDNVVIIGGGFIGVELCEAVGEMWGIGVKLFEKQPQLLPYMLDPEMAAIVQRSLAVQGVDALVDVEVEKVELDSQGKPVVFVKGREPTPADYVFLCLGVHPEGRLARESGLDVSENGAIRVDSALRTSDPDIFAGGDCIESVHRITKQPIYMPMGSLANRHGRVIAENLAGASVEFPGVVGAFVLRAFELNIGGVGLSEQTARGAGLESWSVWGSFPDRPDYNPEAKTLTLKMVYEQKTNRLLGLQAVGRGDICRRIDVFSALLHGEKAVEDLMDFEHGYAPPFAEALDPLHHMAAIAMTRERGVTFVSPDFVHAPVDRDTLVLDVREDEESASAPLPSEISKVFGEALHIPLGQLRERLHEVDRNRRILTICQRGVRSYQAALILQTAGFEDVHILSAGLQAQT
uniref:NADH oxidase n=1 Tax=uncultured sulfate-reducing bacterium TaxID=153939 RepID=Q3IBM8_9BACT|nr:NADH oxidase [uncultured sulfate-reducing bacterium]